MLTLLFFVLLSLKKECFKFWIKVVCFKTQLLYLHFFLFLSLMSIFLLTNAFTRKMLGWLFQSKLGRLAHFEVKQCPVKFCGDGCLSILRIQQQRIPDCGNRYAHVFRLGHTLHLWSYVTFHYFQQNLGYDLCVCGSWSNLKVC